MEKNEEKIDIFSNLANHSIPKWADLPEIDLYMDQVIVLMEKYLSDSSGVEGKLITPSMINNYVKLGLMPAPVKKKYSREHLAYLMIICSLKQVMPISNIKCIIDKKLEKISISDLLDFYSNLYDFTFATFVETFKNYLDSNTPDDAQLFTAIAASNCRNISNKLFYMNNPEKTDYSSKKKNKEN